MIIPLELAAAWGGLLFFDCVIFSLTLKKALAFWNTGEARLMHLLVRDGELVPFSHICSLIHRFVRYRRYLLCVGPISAPPSSLELTPHQGIIPRKSI